MRSLILFQITVQACNIELMLLQALNGKVDHALRVAEDDALVVITHSNEKTTQGPQLLHGQLKSCTSRLEEHQVLPHWS